MTTVNYSYLGNFAPSTYKPVFDPTGTLTSNYVTSEVHTVSADSELSFHVIVPLFAPFFASGLSIVYKPFNSTTTRQLVEGIDYLMAFQFIGATRGCAKPVYGGISLIDPTLAGVFTLAYHTLGGNWCINLTKINEILINNVQNPRVTTWEQIVELPDLFPVVDHKWYLQDLIGMSDVVKAIDELTSSMLSQNCETDIENLRVIMEAEIAQVQSTLDAYRLATDTTISMLHHDINLTNTDIGNLRTTVASNYISLTQAIATASDNLSTKMLLNDTTIIKTIAIINKNLLDIQFSISDMQEDLLSRIILGDSTLLTAIAQADRRILDLENKLEQLTSDMKIVKTNIGIV